MGRFHELIKKNLHLFFEIELFSKQKFEQQIRKIIEELWNQGIQLKITFKHNSEEKFLELGEVVQPSFKQMIQLRRSGIKIEILVNTFEENTSQVDYKEFIEDDLKFFSSYLETFDSNIDFKFFFPLFIADEQRKVERKIRLATDDFPLFIAMFDLDNLGSYNKQDHDNGDIAIKNLGKSLQDYCNNFENLNFYRVHEGGDEFFLFIEKTSLYQGISHLLNLQKHISNIVLSGMEGGLHGTIGLIIIPYDYDLDFYKIKKDIHFGDSWILKKNETVDKKGSFNYYKGMADNVLMLKKGSINDKPLPKGGIFFYSSFIKKPAFKPTSNLTKFIIPVEKLSYFLASTTQFPFFIENMTHYPENFFIRYICEWLKKANTLEELWLNYLSGLLTLNLFINFEQDSKNFQYAINEKDFNWISLLQFFVNSLNFGLFFNTDFFNKFRDVNIFLKIYKTEENTIFFSLVLKKSEAECYEPDYYNVFKAIDKTGYKTCECPIYMFKNEKDISNSNNIIKTDCTRYLNQIEEYNYKNSYNILSPILAVQIGTIEIDPDFLHRTCSAFCIFDDRATREGGLPDFWQSNISRVIRQVMINQNIRYIVFIGNKKYIPNTWNICANIKTNNQYVNQIESFTESKKVNIFKNQIVEVVNFESFSDAKSKIIDILSPGKKRKDIVFSLYSRFLEREGPEIQEEEKPLFSGRLNLKESLLKPEEGLRFLDLEHAYPAIIDLMRNHEMTTYLDQMNQEMCEFRSFKVVFTNPSSLKIPIFFAKAKLEQNFDGYYNQNFINKLGVFSEHILSYHLNDQIINQYEQQLKVVINSIQKNQATRRSGIIIATPGREGEDGITLGLLNILIYPRRVVNEWKIDFIFNWRTVEMIIGFPYSAYGSLKFANEFVKDVNNRLRNQNYVKIGEVIYNAMSLHMFTDKFVFDVAKKIVDQVSK